MKNFCSLFLALLVSTNMACQYKTSQAVQKDINRFESEIMAFEQKDKVSRYVRDLYLFVGSSSFRMWSSLAEDMPDMPVLNRGFGGSTLKELNFYFGRVISKYQPKKVIIYCGENDIAEGTKPEEVYQQFTDLIQNTKKIRTDIEIYFISIKPSLARWEMWPEIQAANKLIETYCGKNDIKYIDVSEVMLVDGQPDPTIFIEDNLHMNALGYERWTSIIRPIISSK